MKYRADIDGLRAIAVLLVVVFHFRLLAFGEAGFIGVDVFFVISGYLISGILWRDLEARTFSLRHFYARRIRRLAPALIAVQLLVLATGLALLLPDELVGLAKESLAAQTYVSNIYYWRTLNYFGLHDDGAFLLHTWSLGVEEQFYLFYPLFLMLVHRWARRWFWPILAATAVLSFALNIVLVGRKPELTFYLLPTRAWELAAGALLPLVEPWFGQHGAARTLAAPLGLALIVATLALHGPGTPFPGWFALLPVGAAALLLLAGTGASNPVSRALSIPPITFFGRISYPLYLVHWPVTVFAAVVLPDYTTPWRWGLFVLSIAIAYAITVAVERPVRAKTWFARERGLVLTYLRAVAAVLVVAILLVELHGWRGRFSNTALQMADIADDHDPRGTEFLLRPGEPLRARLQPIGAAGTAPTWLIYGDSHAGALRLGASTWLAARHEAGEFAFLSNCMPVLDMGSAECRRLNREAVAAAAGKQVLLVSIWREPLDGAIAGRAGKMLTGREAVAETSDAIVRTINALHAAGATVHVWEPLPTATHNVPESMARNATFGPYWSFGRSLTSHRREMGFVGAALDRAGLPHALRIDPAPWLCPQGYCGFTLDGLPLFSDSNHPAAHTAPWFARLLERQSGSAALR